MIRLFLILCFLTFSVRGHSNDNYPKNPDIDAQHYAFKISLHDETDQVEGEASITFTFRIEGLTKLRLDLIGKEPPSEKGMTVDFVRSEGKSLHFSHQHNELWIDLPPTTAGQTVQIEIGYHGVPGAGLLIKRNKYGDRTFFSDNWPNLGRNWLPMIDHPYDKATCEFKVVAPVKYAVISNGLKLEESVQANGMRLTHWKESVPIAPWLFVLGVAEFAVQYVDYFEGKSIQTWVYKQDRDAGFHDFQTPSKEALSFFSDYVGPFVYEKLANIQSNNSTGGMEAASAIMYGERSVTGTRDSRWQNVIVHEIAHQWFGDAVTENDWDDVWLSEGFATYFTLLYTEHAFGVDEFVKGLKSSREQVIRFQKENPDYTVVHRNLSDMSKVTSGQTYQKGAWTLHMLRRLIGDESFQKGIRAYYLKFLNKNAATADFKHEMELASGRDLTGFFQQWLYQGGSPVVKIKWAYREKEKQLVIDMEQTQANYLFDLPVEIAIHLPGKEQAEVRTFNLSGRKGQFKMEVAAKPEKLVGDPYTSLAAEISISQK